MNLGSCGCYTAFPKLLNAAVRPIVDSLARPLHARQQLKASTRTVSEPKALRGIGFESLEGFSLCQDSQQYQHILRRDRCPRSWDSLQTMVHGRMMPTPDSAVRIEVIALPSPFRPRFLRVAI